MRRARPAEPSRPGPRCWWLTGLLDDAAEACHGHVLQYAEPPSPQVQALLQTLGVQWQIGEPEGIVRLDGQGVDTPSPPSERRTHGDP